MPEALFACNPQATYLIFDLPESLLISSSYLPISHPNTEIIDYQSQKDHSTIGRDDLQPGQIWFCGSQDLQKLSPNTIDVFLSVYTFQEMQKYQVDTYFNLIDHTTSGYFYTAQKWKASLPTEFSGFVEYPFNPDWVEQFSRNSTYSSQYFETCFALGN
jgi:putative sugar O-methyltransferase